MEYDELELDTLGDRKCALFVIISDTEIIVAIPYALAEVPSLFGREGIPVKDGWAKRIVEFGCWCGFAVIALMVI